MSNNASKTSGGRATLPNSYTVESFTVTLNDGTMINAKDLLVSFVIHESLFSPTINAEFRILDGFGMLVDGHIIGGEEVELKVIRIDNSKDTYANSSNKIHLKLNIANIFDHTTPKVGLQSYTLTCLSKHAFINISKTLNRSFTGVIHDLIDKICSNDLKTKINSTGNSSDEIVGIYPDLKPLDAIQWLLRNISDETTPYFFYDTIQDGLQLNSYKQLINEDSYRKYNNSPFFQTTVGTKEYFEESTRKITSLNSDLNMSIYKSIDSGVYASRTDSLDISTKSYKRSDYSYKNNEKINSSGKPFSDKIEFDNRILSDNYDSKQFCITKNSLSFNTKNNYHNVIEESIGDKNSKFNALSFIGLDMTTYGDLNMTVGKILDLNIMKSTDSNVQDRNRKNGMVDKLLSGKYIITELAHVFNGTEYICDIGIQKDSLTYNIDSDIKIGK